MKKLLSGLAVVVIGLGSIGQGAVLDDAVQYLYEKGYTIYNTTTGYKANNYMRRDEAAKFFVRIAKDLNVSYTKTEAQCTFPDLNEGHADLKNDIIESCRMGIFQGSNGKFNPRGSLTNAQAITVLLRIVSGRESEMGVTHWADNYYKLADRTGWLSLFPVLNTKDGLATRGTVAQLVYIIIVDGDLGVKGPLYYEYNNPGLKFSLQFPKSWEGYLLKESGGNFYTIQFGFGTPFKMEELFYIIIMDKEMREYWQDQPGQNFKYLGEKDNVIFISNHGQAVIEGLEEQAQDINNILQSFKLLY